MTTATYHRTPYILVDGKMEPGLDEALTSSDPGLRAVARLTAAGFNDVVGDWVTAELERGTEPGMLLRVLCNAQAGVFASLVASLMHRLEEGKYEELYVTDFRRAFKNTLPAARKQIAELAATRGAATDGR